MSTPEQEKLDDAVVAPELDIQERVEAEVENAERDYTEERNCRVLPLVKQIIDQMGDFQFAFNRGNTAEEAKAERESFSTFVRSEFMPVAIENNLKLTDLNYAFKLLSTTIQMLQARANTPADATDERLTMAAQSILKKLGNEETLMLNFHSDRLDKEAGEKRAALYDRFYKEIVVETFTQFNIQYNETQHVFTLMKSIKDEVSSKVEAEISSAKMVVEMKAWGVDDLDELDILTVHKKVVE